MYANIDSQIGFPAIGLGNLSNDTPARLTPGTILTVVDPWWSTGEVIWARAASNIRAQGLCVLLPVFDAAAQEYRYDASEVPNTANLGRPLCVALGSFTAGQYGWFLVTGVTPVNSSASIAADAAAGIAATGQAGANSAGKQILNSRFVAPATTTVAKAGCLAPSGTNVLQVPNSDGWFVGAYLSGTGIQAGTIVSSIDSSGRFVTISASTSAQVNGTVTATYNNGATFFNVIHINRPFAQGAIT